MSFRTKEDYEDFQKKIGQRLTEKTKSTWHPLLDVTANSLLRWMDEEND
jgi:succinate dehydrogenase flavin-adding protein (antitoxin of CptAB toxin-antitoxin module)